jgi:hypothetical protein
MEIKNSPIDDKPFVLCGEHCDGTMLHLFFSCDFSHNLWWKVGEEWNTDFHFINMLIEAKKKRKYLQSCYDCLPAVLF